MKKIILGLIVLGLVGCGEERKEKVVVKEVKRILADKLIPAGSKDSLGAGGVLKRGEVYYYKNKPFNGIGFGFYDNAQICMELNFKDGKMDGLDKWYHENGQLAWESNYKDGKKDGLWKWWHENGQLKSESNYKDDVKLSKKCWDDEGNEIDCPK